MLTNRRNVAFRVSIVINVAVLLYALGELFNGLGKKWVPGGGGETAKCAYLKYPTEYVEARNETPTADTNFAVHVLNQTNSSILRFTVFTNKKNTLSTIELKKQSSQETMASITPSGTSEETVDDGLEQVEQNALSGATLVRLQRLLACNDRDFLQRTYQRGEYWVLQNYVRADHGTVSCFGTVTYTTPADYEFLDNVEPLAARWMAPISIAVHTPGFDLAATVDSIRYLRDCTENDLVRQYVTFHVFFSYKHVPAEVPSTKTQLQAMLANSTAIPFHKYVCSVCHKIPQAERWMITNDTGQMDVFHVAKRTGKYLHWEPFYIGTHQEPYYDERLSWDGRKNKIMQAYVLCVQDYDFMVLNNAFLCHKPGIKKYMKNHKRGALTKEQNDYIEKYIMPELEKMYGSRAGCVV